MKIISYLFYALLLVVVLLVVYARWCASAEPSHVERYMRTGVGKIEAMRELEEKDIDRMPEEEFILGMTVGEYADEGREIKRTMKHLTRAVKDVVRRRDVRPQDDFIVRRANDLRVVAAPFIDDVAINEALFNLFGEAQERVELRTDAARVATAAQANSRTEALDIAFAQTHTSDSQNVHDGAVLSDTRRVLDRIRSDGWVPTIDEIETYCEKYLGPDKLLDARKVLVELRKENDIYALGTNESEVLRQVWARAHHENNATNRKLIHEAICDALVDCIDRATGKPVCITGRATRIVGALATLDFDKDVDKIQTFEMYKNEIFNDVKKTIEQHIKSSKASGDETLTRGASLYENGAANSAEDIIAERAFKDIIKGIIDEKCGIYASRLKPEDLAHIRETCVVYADVA